jgi:hypothetical protein
LIYLKNAKKNENTEGSKIAQQNKTEALNLPFNELAKGKTMGKIFRK